MRLPVAASSAALRHVLSRHVLSRLLILPRLFTRVSATALVAAALLVPQGDAWAEEEEMTFQAVELDGASVISATGRITDRTPQMFLDFLRGPGRGDLHAVVFLDSPGGGVIASMEFGTLMRKIGAAAVVAKVSPSFFGHATMTNAQCFSACVYALIGARKRVIPPQSEVGIHRMFLSIEGSGDVTAYASAEERAEAGGIRAQLSRYTGRMGVSPELIAYAEHTPSYDLHILSRAEIKKWHLGVPNL